MKPTYDDLLKTIARLEKRVAELEERLNLSSQNSSKPPSTDRKKNKRSPKGGAVKGHRGHFRKLLPEVDKHVLSHLKRCEHCGCENLEKKSPQIFRIRSVGVRR